jgi:hypothetical protein
MSYVDRPDHFYSNWTRKTYPFVKGDTRSKREASEQLFRDHIAFRQAAEQRAKTAGVTRRLTDREVGEGGWAPDTRSIRQQVVEDATHVTIDHRPRDLDHNGFAERAAFLEERLSLTRDPKARAGLQVRLDGARRAAEKHEAATVLRKEHEAVMAKPGVESAIVYGNASLCLLRVRGDVKQEWIDKLSSAMDALKRDGNVDNFYAVHDSIDAERSQIFGDRAKAADAEAAALKAKAVELRRDKSGDRAVVAAIKAAQESAADA